MADPMTMHVTKAGDSSEDVHGLRASFGLCNTFCTVQASQYMHACMHACQQRYVDQPMHISVYSSAVMTVEDSAPLQGGGMGGGSGLHSCKCSSAAKLLCAMQTIPPQSPHSHIHRQSIWQTLVGYSPYNEAT